VQSFLAARAGAEPAIIAAAAHALRMDAARVAVLAAAVAALGLLRQRGSLALSRATALLALLLFLDVAATTIDLSWTRPTVALRRPAYLPEITPHGPRVMRLAEVGRSRLALDERAFSEEQLRQAALLSPMSNALHHASVLEPYGFYMGEVAVAMAKLASHPMALAEVSAVDIVLAAPGARAPWLAEALQSGRLLPRASLEAGAVALRPARAMPRSYLATRASLLAEGAIPERLASGSPSVLVAAERGLREGSHVPLQAQALPESLLAGPADVTSLPPTAWQPGESHYRVATARPALFVEMDVFMPGWRVFVDGVEQTALQANMLGRAVVVPAGQHEITWRFFPRLLVASLLASWFGLLIGAALCLVRRKPSRVGLVLAHLTDGEPEG